MGLNTPLNIHWEMTNACNLRCVHCYQQDDGPRRPVPSAKILWAIAHRIIEARVFELTLTGGEPLLVRSLPELIHYFNSHGVRPHITSNGMLVTDAAANWLAAANITFQVSIDSSDAAVHNRIRQSPRAFDLALAGIRRLVARGVNVSIAYTAMPDNLSDVETVVQLGADLGVSRVCIGEVLPSFGSHDTRRALSIAPEQYGLFIETLLGLESRYGDLVQVHVSCFSGHKYDARIRAIACTAMERDMAILYDGWAYPCPFVRSPHYRLGNVVDQSIQEIWANHVARRFRDEKRAGAEKHCITAGSPLGAIPLRVVSAREISGVRNVP